ncbi:polysaccharide pyruvyl transferase family protein [Mucilaginibacter sp.]|uniref:polysaccharide pyruvyl transferase family protein n=1 Tax=Mucilaginibacter sp. TaxID=1882438 RepID=UPI002636DEB5|nr:polysaccharide pyruvyl transferase family protein [Mucilaginibacter sp.]MDB4919041.1 hypothetical protein [Mucilaginibacter sp.]
MPNITITLVGWNCRKNLGDDVMTDVIIDNLSKKYPEALFKIIGDQNSLPAFQSTLNNKAIKVKAIKNFDRYNSIPVIRTFFNRIYIVLLIALKSDIIIIGGGTIYHSTSLTGFYQQIAHLKNIFNSKCKIYSIGVSIGPFKNDEELTAFKKFVPSVDFFSVRDNRSMTVLSKNENAVLAPDLALGYPLTKEFNENKQNSIAIILRQGHIDEKTNKFLTDFILGFNKQFPAYTIKFHSFCEYYLSSENDTLAIEGLIRSNNFESLPVEIVKYNNNPHEFCELLSRSKLIISVRLHGAILGYALKVPFFMISYHSKCVDFFNELNLDKKFMIDVNQSAEIYVDEAGKILNNSSIVEFKDDYSFLSLNHFKVNG